MAPSRAFLGSLIAALMLAACDDPPARKAQLEPADEPKPPPPSQPAAPTGPPDLVIDNIGPKVGFSRINLQFPEARGKLAAEIAEVKPQFEGKEVRLRVDRKALPDWVKVYLAELGNAGFARILVQTETRKEFPSELRFTPDNQLSDPPACSVVAMVLADRSTAVWKLGGGVAGKRPKGMAGPDLTMTGETIERNAKACKAGNALFVAGAPEIEWGLVYDLAASAQTLTDARFDARVLLTKQPVPGHKVELPR